MSGTIRASELVRKAIGRELPAGTADFVVRGLTADSRQVGEGWIFAAVAGTQVDGADFAGQAAAKGAGLVVSHRAIEGVDALVVEKANESLAKLAWAYYGIGELQSAGKLHLYGVTGTNGKTTFCYLFQHLANRMGRRCGRFGTVEYDLVGRKVEASHTTPDTVQMARLIREAADNGADSIVMELSSHALEQGRAAGLRFSGGAFTNLTGDHLDYHKTMENYLAAKLILFRSLPAEGVAVVNVDDAVGEKVLSASGGRTIGYGIENAGAELRATELEMTAGGTRCRIGWRGERAELRTPYIGKHNVYNMLAAVGMGLGAGFELGAVCEAMSAAPVVPGRLERVENGLGFEVFVDYAHTDDGLVNVLSALKPLVRNRLIVVFGCGGDRDRTKRPRMAKAAETYGDVVIVTNDNPRTEDEARIFADIMTGFSEGFKERIRVEADRRKAIGAAIGAAEAGDIVLIAGKGHETYQIIGKEKFPFDDVAEAKGVLSAKC